MVPPDTDLYTRLGRLEGKIDQVLDSQRAIASDLDDHQAQISELKTRHQYYMGGLAGLMGVLVFAKEKISTALFGG